MPPPAPEGLTLTLSPSPMQALYSGLVNKEKVTTQKGGNGGFGSEKRDDELKVSGSYHVTSDLIYVTSYDKPNGYVDELLEEVRCLAMLEASARARGGTPRYAFEVAKQCSHSAKHPLMAQGYLASSKVEQNSRVYEGNRLQSARKWFDATSSRRMYFCRPETAHHFLSKAWAVKNSLNSNGGADLNHGRTNRTTLLRGRSAYSSTPNLSHATLKDEQGEAMQKKKKLRDAEMKLKLESRDLAKNAEMVHAFLIGAKYNKPRWVEELTECPAERDSQPNRRENPKLEPADRTHYEKKAVSVDVKQNANSEASRPSSTATAPTTSSALTTKQVRRWTELHADNPPLYQRPYSGAAASSRQLSGRPLSALQKSIHVRQLQTMSSAAYHQPGTGQAPSMVRPQSAQVPDHMRSSAASQNRDSTSRRPSRSDNLNLLVMSQKMAQHPHSHAMPVPHPHVKEGRVPIGGSEKYPQKGNSDHEENESHAMPTDRSSIPADAHESARSAHTPTKFMSTRASSTEDIEKVGFLVHTSDKGNVIATLMQALSTSDEVKKLSGSDADTEQEAAARTETSVSSRRSVRVAVSIAVPHNDASADQLSEGYAND